MKKMVIFALVSSFIFVAAIALAQTSGSKGKIGDPVAPCNNNVVGGYPPSGVSGGVITPTTQTMSSPMGTDQTKTAAAKGKVGDPVAPANNNVVGGYPPNGVAGGVITPTTPTQSGAIK